MASLAAISSRTQRASRAFTSTSASTSRARVVKVQAFKVTFKSPSGQSSTIDCAPDTYILNAAMAAGVAIPHSCKSGACCTCAGKIEEGTADQSDQYILDEGQLNGGFILPCAAYPRSDMVILTEQEENLYNLYSR